MSPACGEPHECNQRNLVPRQVVSLSLPASPLPQLTLIPPTFWWGILTPRLGDGGRHALARCSGTHARRKGCRHGRRKGKTDIKSLEVEEVNRYRSYTGSDSWRSATPTQVDTVGKLIVTNCDIFIVVQGLDTWTFVPNIIVQYTLYLWRMWPSQRSCK